jgi:phage gp46-like protein
MSDADLIQFRQYADEALRWAVQSNNEKGVFVESSG